MCFVSLPGDRRPSEHIRTTAESNRNVARARPLNQQLFTLSGPLGKSSSVMGAGMGHIQGLWETHVEARWTGPVLKEPHNAACSL